VHIRLPSPRQKPESKGLVPKKQMLCQQENFKRKRAAIAARVGAQAAVGSNRSLPARHSLGKAGFDTRDCSLIRSASRIKRASHHDAILSILD
jgi:hypothetical protein